MVNKNSIINNLDILVLAFISVAVLLLGTYTNSIARSTCGIFFIVFIPGYSLISALFPDRYILNNLQRLLLSILSSICIVSLGGLLLSLINQGISSYWTFICNAGLSLIFLFIAGIRRNKLTSEQRYGIIPLIYYFKHLITGEEKAKPLRLVILLLVIFIAAGSIFALNIISVNSGTNDSEEFYILPDDNGSNDNFPRTVKSGKMLAIEVNVVNNRSETMNYILRTLLEGHSITADYEISLIAGEKWKTDIAFTLNKLGDNQKVEYQLLEKDSNKLISSLYLWIDVADETD